MKLLNTTIFFTAINLSFMSQVKAVDQINSSYIQLDQNVLISLERKLPDHLQRVLEFHRLPPAIKVKLSQLMSAPTKPANAAAVQTQQFKMPSSAEERFQLIKSFTDRVTMLNTHPKLTKSEKELLISILPPARSQPDSEQSSMLHNLLCNIQDLKIRKEFLDFTSFNPTDQENIVKHNRFVEQVAIEYDKLNKNLEFINQNIQSEEQDKQAKTFREITNTIRLIHDLGQMMYTNAGGEGAWNPSSAEEALSQTQQGIRENSSMNGASAMSSSSSKQSN